MRLNLKSSCFVARYHYFKPDILYIKSIPNGCGHWDIQPGESQAEPMEEQSDIWFPPSPFHLLHGWQTPQSVIPVFHILGHTPLCREGLYPKFLNRQMQSRANTRDLIGDVGKQQPGSIAELSNQGENPCYDQLSNLNTITLKNQK